MSYPGTGPSGVGTYGRHRWYSSERLTLLAGRSYIDSCDSCTQCGCFDSYFKSGELPREDYAREAQQRDLEQRENLAQQLGDQLPPYPGEPSMHVPKPPPSYA